LLSGVYGGEASGLSVRAVLPRFTEMEAKYGSLGRAMLAARSKMGHAAPARPLFTSLKDGMQQMVDALLARLREDSLRPGTPVASVEGRESTWLLHAAHVSHHFDAVIVATPARAAADLLQPAHAGLAQELGAISYTSSV